MATLTDLPAETDALPGGHESPAEAAEDDEKELPEIAAELWQIVTRVSAEEFRWQESHYDSDSRRGRELLFLIANNEWVRATSEIIDISRSDSIETTIKIDVDLDRVTHEAFRNRTGRFDRDRCSGQLDADAAHRRRTPPDVSGDGRDHRQHGGCPLARP